MKIVHVLSTAPWRAARPGMPFEKDIIETLTMALAIAKWDELGNPLEIYTDAEGHEWLKSQKLDGFYSRINTLFTPVTVDHRVFWSLSKCIALAAAGDDAMVADTDLVVYQKPAFFNQTIVIGHREPAWWECYANNQQKFSRYGSRTGWRWDVEPINTCLLRLGRQEFREQYLDWALNFAENYTAHPLSSQECPNWWYQPDLFADQHLLAMLLDHYSWPDPAGEMFNVRLQHHEPTARGFHLWGRKEVYRTCVEPRQSMGKYLLARLKQTRLADWGTALSLNFDDYRPSYEQIQYAGRVAVMRSDPTDNKFSRSVITQSGQCQAMDPCTGEMRILAQRDKIYRGDVLHFSKPQTKADVFYNQQGLCFLDGEEPGEVAGKKEAAIWRTDLA